MTSAPSSSPNRADGRGSPADRPKPSNRLASFPPEATVTLALVPERSTHVDDLIGDEKTAIIVAVSDPIDDVSGVKSAIQTASDNGVEKVVVLVTRPTSITTYFRDSVRWLCQVGYAPDVHVPSRELALMISIEGARGTLRNAYLVVAGGAIVWSSAVTDKRHDVAGLEKTLKGLASRAADSDNLATAAK